MSVSNIAPALAGQVIPIDSVEPHPRNARQGDIGAISESLRVFGQVRPIVVQDSTGYIVAGRHVWGAAVALGWTEIAASRVEMSDALALRYLVADNRLSALGSFDEAALTAVLVDLAQQGLLEGTGYDGDDVDTYLRDLGLMAGDPGAGILDAFAHVPKSDRNELGIRQGRDADGTTYYPLHLPLTAAQRDLWLQACRAAKAAGHETQPAALEAMCRAYLGGNG